MAPKSEKPAAPAVAPSLILPHEPTADTRRIISPAEAIQLPAQDDDTVPELAISRQRRLKDERRLDKLCSRVIRTEDAWRTMQKHLSLTLTEARDVFQRLLNRPVALGELRAMMDEWLATRLDQHDSGN